MIPDTKIPNTAPRVPADFHILIAWGNLVRCLASVAPSQGYSVLSIRVIVDAEGKVVQYTKPDVTRLEPKANGEQMQALLDTLTNP